MFAFIDPAQMLLRESNFPFLLGDKPHPHMPLLMTWGKQREEKGNKHSYSDLRERRTVVKLFILKTVPENVSCKSAKI